MSRPAPLVPDPLRRWPAQNVSMSENTCFRYLWTAEGLYLCNLLSFALGASVSLVCVCLGCAGSPIHSTKAHGLEPLRTVSVLITLAYFVVGAPRRGG